MQSVVEICWRHLCCRTQCTERVDFEESTIPSLTKCRGKVESEGGTIPYRTQCSGRIQDSEGGTIPSEERIDIPFLPPDSECCTIPSEEEIKF